jgi:hypothetical protein
MLSKQTTLDLNGPILSFTTQPVGILTSTNDNARFTGVATATFPTQTPANPASNTGYISYQWHEVGVGALSNSSTISGATSTTLTISGLRSPNDNGRQFFLRADYVASAYGQNPITVGTARSTGNAVNDTLDSDIVTLAIYPTLAISSQPLPQTVSGTRSATFNVTATTSDSSDSSLSYNWLLNGGILTNSANVLNSNTNQLTISLPARYDASVHHEISSNTTTAFTITNTGDYAASGSARNPGGATANGLDPGTTLNNDNRRHYDITFQSDIGTTNYDVEVTNISAYTAAGTYDTGIGVGAISKRSNGFKIWFYRSGEFVCSTPGECLLYVWPPSSGSPTDTSSSGSQSNLFGGLSINTSSPSTWVQQKAIATGINYSGTFSITGRMREYSPNKTVDFRIRAVLPNGTTVATSNSTATGSGARYDMDLNFGPLSTLEPLTLVIDARFPDNQMTTGINVDSSSASWSGTNRTYAGAVSTIDTHVRDFKFSLLSANKIQAKVSHPAANNSPIYSNPVDYNIVSARKIINVEYANEGGSGGADAFATVNLFDNNYTLAAGDYPARLTCFYAAEKDIDVIMEIYGQKGVDGSGYRGGEGGVSVIRTTLRRNEEYIITSLPQSTGTGGVFIYRKSRLIICVGGGGSAGNGGNGGNGGGVNVSGASGSGRGAGNGGSVFSPGSLPSDGVFGSLATGLTGLYPGDSTAPYPLGGRVIPCPKGYWYGRGYSPCQDVGVQQLWRANGNLVTNSAYIDRGFKSGYGIRNTAGGGLSGGGNGGAGATGGNGGNGGGGGGGGSGYYDGSVQVLSTQQGGNPGTARVIIRSA